MKTLFAALLYVAHLAVIGCDGDGIFHLFRHPEDSPAKCLDGSPSFFYISKGDLSKFLVGMFSDAPCLGLTLQETLDNCYNRLDKIEGSSKHLPADFDLSGYHSISSSNPMVNPLYATWTKIIMVSCDGGVNMGSRSAPISYKGSNIFFRGTDSTLAHFDFLQLAFNFYDAKNITLYGYVGGGLAATAWANHVYAKATHKEGVMVVVDSGIYLSDFVYPGQPYTLNDYLVNIQKLVFAEIEPPYRECFNQFGLNCTFREILPTLKPPLFVIQSEYDPFPLSYFDCINGVSMSDCSLEDMAAIEAYRSAFLQLMQAVAKDEKNGVWTIACIAYLLLIDEKLYTSSDYLVPGITGVTPIQALISFVTKTGERNHIDQAKWPNNRACSGLESANLMKE